MKKFIICVVVVCMLVSSVGFTYYHTERQEKAHEIAEIARSMGLPENDPIIIRASQIWWEEEMTKEPDTISVTGEDRERIVTMIAKVIFGEARGVESVTEQACIVWTILNRVDAGYGNIEDVVTAANQFAYDDSFPTVDDYGRDLKELAEDVICRWEREHAGETDVGRVLPSNYLYYGGRNGHNYFRPECYNFSNLWDYSLGTPYGS